MISKFLAILLNLGAAIASAQVPTEKTFQLSWEHPAEGVLLATTLTSTSSGDAQKGKITLYLKNTSSDRKSVIIIGDGSWIRFILLENDGTEHDLRTYKRHESTSGREEIFDPGSIWSHSIDISPKELSEMRNQKVEIIFGIYDWVTKQKSTIQSSPQVLQVIAGQPPR